MAEARKFLFDRDFTREQPVVPAGEPVVEEPPPDPATLPAYSEIDLQAVRAAAARAQPGDVLLLSPACASWGQFINYEHRGDSFAALVKSL